MDRVRVSRAVIRLADKGLLTRKTQEGDKRAQVLRLSRSGLATYRQIVPLARKLQAELAASLEPEELHVLDRVPGQAPRRRGRTRGTSGRLTNRGGSPSCSLLTSLFDRRICACVASSPVLCPDRLIRDDIKTGGRACRTG